MTPSLPALTVTDDAPEADIARLEARLDAFNMSATGIFDARLLSIVLKRPDGEVYAGLHGHTWGGCCEIKLLWIDEAERGAGLGAALIEAAESEARSRGCRKILLSTHSFQAPEFYEKQGYERVATIDGYPAGHDHILLVKRLEG